MSRINLFDKRRAGVLLHITSLPPTRSGDLLLGDLGEQAYRFVSLLKSWGMSVWQVLPIHPLYRLDDLSPYQPQSVHAGNPWLINLEWFAQRNGNYQRRWLTQVPTVPKMLHPQEAFAFRRGYLEKAHDGFTQRATPEEKEAYQQFKDQHKEWLDDYAMFCVLKEAHNGLPWWQWSKEYRDRDSNVLAKFVQQYQEAIEQRCFEQFVFRQQWDELKQFANQQGVYLFGDLPFFVAHDSVETWVYRDHFLLDDKGECTKVAGSCDDHFSKEGQNWGYPLYAWQIHQNNNFNWWIRRFKTVHELFDLVRLTHFRGFVACWEIPANSQRPTQEGRWLRSSEEAVALFSKLKEEFTKENNDVSAGFSATDLFQKQRPKCEPCLRDGLGWEITAVKELLDKLEVCVSKDTQYLPWMTENLGYSKEKDIEEEIDKLCREFRIAELKLLQVAFYYSEGYPDLANTHLPHHHFPRSVAYTGTHDSQTLKQWFENLPNKSEKGDRQDFVKRYLGKKDLASEQVPYLLIERAFQSVSKLAMISMQDLLMLKEEGRMNTPATQTEKNWRWRIPSWDILNGVKGKLDGQTIEQKLQELKKLYER